MVETTTRLISLVGINVEANAFVLELELLYALLKHLFRATLTASSHTMAWSLAPTSVQRSSLLTVRLHRLNFNVVLRKPIPKLQAFSKSIQETSMVRFYSSIHSDDKKLIRQMNCDSVFHGVPYQNAAAYRRKTECVGSFTDRLWGSVIRVGNSLFWRTVMTVESSVEFSIIKILPYSDR